MSPHLRPVEPLPDGVHCTLLLSRCCSSPPAPPVRRHRRCCWCCCSVVLYLCVVLLHSLTLICTHSHSLTAPSSRFSLSLMLLLLPFAYIYTHARIDRRAFRYSTLTHVCTPRERERESDVTRSLSFLLVLLPPPPPPPPDTVVIVWYIHHRTVLHTGSRLHIYICVYIYIYTARLFTRTRSADAAGRRPEQQGRTAVRAAALYPWFLLNLLCVHSPVDPRDFLFLHLCSRARSSSSSGAPATVLMYNLGFCAQPACVSTVRPPREHYASPPRESSSARSARAIVRSLRVRSMDDVRKESREQEMHIER